MTATGDRPIKFARGLALPVSVATQTVAALARKGAGKTYAMMKLVEELLGAGVQVVILDAIGVWYGLRLSTDGTKPSGLAIPILGGYRGDIPLKVEVGALIATTLVESGQSAILDVSEFRQDGRKRFATDFAEELLHLKKDPARRSPIFVVLEEAQLYAPQKADAGNARMLGAFEDLVKLGRNYGIGVGMISQRPQAINKDVLNQTELLIVLQTNGPQERATIKNWIVENDADGVDLVAELPKLQTGEAFVWSPGWLRFFGRVQISKKHTYDASATPDGSTVAAMKPKPIDLGALAAAMADAVEAQRANDPKALKAEIESLRLAVQAAEADVARAGDEVDEVRRQADAFEREAQTYQAEADRLRSQPREVPILDPRHTAALEAFAMAIRELSDRQLDVAGRVGRIVEEHTALALAINESIRQWQRGDPSAAAAGPHRQPITRAEAAATDTEAVRRPMPPAARDRHGPRLAGRQPTRAASLKGDGLKAGARVMLEAIAAAGDRPIAKQWVATWSGVTLRGGTFQDYLSKLRRLGYIVDDGAAAVRITTYGATAVGDGVRLSRAEVVDRNLRKLKAGARAMWATLQGHGGQLTKADLARLAGVTLRGGTFQDYLSKLRTVGLVEDVNAATVTIAAAIRALR